MIGCNESYSYDFVCLLERGSHYAAKTNLETTVSHRLGLNSRLRSILSQLPSARTMVYTTMAGSPWYVDRYCIDSVNHVSSLNTHFAYVTFPNPSTWYVFLLISSFEFLSSVFYNYHCKIFVRIKFAYMYFINFDSYCKFDFSLDFYFRSFYFRLFYFRLFIASV